MPYEDKIMVASGDSEHPGTEEVWLETIPRRGGEGHVYDLEFNDGLDELTLTEDSSDKTTIPLAATFVGTHAEWEALSALEKANYRLVHFTEDGGIGVASDAVVGFTSSDVVDGNANDWTSVTPITTGLNLKTLWERASMMFKNVRYLFKMLGTTDISSIGNGTVTGAINTLKNTLSNNIIKSSNSFSIIGGYSGNAGSESKSGSFTFSKGTYKKFIILLYLNSYTVGIVDTLTEDELIAICNTGNAYVKSTVGAWNTAYSIINISLSGNTFTCMYNARNTASSVTARLYGCTV